MLTLWFILKGLFVLFLFLSFMAFIFSEIGSAISGLLILIWLAYLIGSSI